MCVCVCACAFCVNQTIFYDCSQQGDFRQVRVRACVYACVCVCVLYALNLEIVRQNRVYLHPVGCADLWGAGRTGPCRKG